MSGVARFSQLFLNESGGGVLLALPYEGLPDWDGTGDDYAEVIAEEEPFLVRPVGPTFGLFVGDAEGIHEAHWMWLSGQPGVILVVWSAWHDPRRTTLPENLEEVARAWEKGMDPRQAWLEEHIEDGGLTWTRHDELVPIASGVLVLLHGEEQAAMARLAKLRSIAKNGELVPADVAPGEYHVETAVIDELPDGRNLCFLARWAPAAMRAGA